MPAERYSWVGLRLRGETSFAGFSSQSLVLPEGLPPDVDRQRGVVLEAQLQTDAEARRRGWVLLAGPVLRMHGQPAMRMHLKG